MLNSSNALKDALSNDKELVCISSGHFSMMVLHMLQ